MYVSMVKWSNPGNGVAPSAVVAIEKGAFVLPLTTVAIFALVAIEKETFGSPSTKRSPTLLLLTVLLFSNCLQVNKGSGNAMVNLAYRQNNTESSWLS